MGDGNLGRIRMWKGGGRFGSGYGARGKDFRGWFIDGNWRLLIIRRRRG